MAWSYRQAEGNENLAYYRDVHMGTPYGNHYGDWRGALKWDTLTPFRRTPFQDQKGIGIGKEVPWGAPWRWPPGSRE